MSNPILREKRLQETGTSVNPDVPLEDFMGFCKLIGFEEVWAFERAWALDHAATA